MNKNMLIENPAAIHDSSLWKWVDDAITRTKENFHPGQLFKNLDDSQFVDVEKMKKEISRELTNYLKITLSLESRDIYKKWVNKNLDRARETVILFKGNMQMFQYAVDTFQNESKNKLRSLLNGIVMTSKYEKWLHSNLGYAQETIKTFNDDVDYFDWFVKKPESKKRKREIQKLPDGLLNSKKLTRDNLPEEFKAYILKAEEIQKSESKRKTIRKTNLWKPGLVFTLVTIFLDNNFEKYRTFERVDALLDEFSKESTRDNLPHEFEAYPRFKIILKNMRLNETDVKKYFYKQNKISKPSGTS